MKTVFFGPFVGEFGWELLFWQGWVKDVSRSVFKDYHKIVSSFPGRHPFYPEADEFWPHPDWLSAKNYSQRGYITDWWKNGLPAPNIVIRKYKLGFRRYFESTPIVKEKRQDASDAIRDLFDSYKKRLPEDTVYFTPFALNKCPKYNITFGADIADNPLGMSDFKTKRIDFKYQLLEKIIPTPKGEEAFLSIAKGVDKIIAVLPRKRDHRRPDKNWQREKYDSLIAMLQQRFKDYVIAILGEPGGAFYAEGVPEGCIDLINLDPNLRMDIQVAALKHAELSIGSMSGATIFALACGCPSITFAFFGQAELLHRQNFLGTRLIYYPEMDPEPEIILRLAEGMINHKIPPQDRIHWDALDYFGTMYKFRKKIMRYLKEAV